MQGIITRLNLDRGYGFINVPRAPSVFFHCRDLAGLLFDDRLEGQRVEFDTITTDKGLRAVNIKEAR